MQHSNKALITKRIVKIIIFAIVMIAINHIFRMGLEFPEEASEEMLKNYTYTENLDTLVVGSSVAEMISAEKLNEILGCNSYNMCSPSQSYGITADVIKIAASQNQIKKIYYFASLDATERRYDDIPERTFKKIVNASHPLPQRIWSNIKWALSKSVNPDNVKNQDSINVWFPWIVNNVNNADTIKSNYSKRMSSYISGKGLGSGFGFDLGKKIYDVKSPVMTDADKVVFDSDIEKLKAIDMPDGMVEEKALRDLDTLCRLCGENDIELYMFISPHRSDYRDRYGDNYEPLTNYMKDFVENRGAFYYNFESNPDIHNMLPDEYFYDWEHVSGEWVDDATTVIADQIAVMEGR